MKANVTLQWDENRIFITDQNKLKWNRRTRWHVWAVKKNGRAIFGGGTRFPGGCYVHAHWASKHLTGRLMQRCSERIVLLKKKMPMAALHQMLSDLSTLKNLLVKNGWRQIIQDVELFCVERNEIQIIKCPGYQMWSGANPRSLEAIAREIDRWENKM